MKIKQNQKPQQQNDDYESTQWNQVPARSPSNLSLHGFGVFSCHLGITSIIESKLISLLGYHT